MDTNITDQIFMLVLFLCLLYKAYLVLGADTIFANDVLSGESTIVSAGGVFEMGFFQPGPAPNYYVGIWYVEDHARKAVWVANRDKPVSLASQLKISDGNLALFEFADSKIPVWSTNISSNNPSPSTQAVLQDTGNLVLNDRYSTSSKPLWESSEYPTHTWLPGAQLGYNKITKRKQVLTSWKNAEDPAPGLFSVELDQRDTSFIALWNRSKNYWISGSWDTVGTFGNYPSTKFDYIYTFQYVSNKNESYFTYSVENTYTKLSHFQLDVSGQVKQENLLPTSGWKLFWSYPTRQCDVYALCGPYGCCNEKASPFCRCLPGFEPKSQSDWDLEDYSGGCVRKTKLQCGNNSTSVANAERDRFLEMPSMPLPENKQPVKTTSLAECESTCLNECSCTAYAYDSTGCSTWKGELLNLVQLGAGDDSLRTLYIRLAASEFRNHKGVLLRNRNFYILLFGSIAIVVVTSCIFCYVYYLRRKKAAKEQGNTRNVQENQVVHSYDSERQIADFILLGQLREDEEKDIEVPFVALDSILAATDSFSEANKLGHGGFGSVYKGKCSGGQEIAIKRLVNGSGQGLHEFKNEVLLIAKLQHRNLVRLLGYCAEGDEKMLLYEYMPNKSLDLFIFDGALCVLLKWEIRFNIILGIARGLLYLHHDSRLRIIHRDLKTSNILLDGEMNPKISDFGLARIFGGEQTEASTNRVVGTYGYMSPEYALHGLFSIKSDVFSFGVVILEIISGKRSTGFYESEQSLSLLDYAWKLWKENRALDLMDPILSETCKANEFLTCLTVGLLCVQDDLSDRPTMSDVVFMLRGEATSLPIPKQPAFFVKGPLSSIAFIELSSNNKLTDAYSEGR